MFNTGAKTIVSCLGLLLTLLFAACQPVQMLPATQTTGAVSAATKKEDASKAVVQRLYEEVMNQKQLNVADEIFDANVVDHNGGPNGGEAAKAGVAVVLTGLPDLQVTADLWVIEGDLVTARATFSGTQTGELMGVAPSGKPVTWTHIDIHRVQNGKITDIWHNIPVSDILHQIQEDPPAKTDTGKTEMEAANQAVVQRFYDEVVNKKNLEVFQEVFDPNMVAHELGIGAFITDTVLLAGLPDLQIKVDLWVIEGDLVTAVVTASGTHQAEIMGVAPTGNLVTWSSIDIWRVKDGKITDVWHNAPNADILLQLGYTLVPPVK